MSSSRGEDSPKPSTSGGAVVTGPSSTSQFAEAVARIGPPPDLSHRQYLKYRYGIKQRKYVHAVKVQQDLKLELNEKQDKVQRLQDEIDLILDQLYAKEYAHLTPARDNLFSDDEQDQDVGPPPAAAPAAQQADAQLQGKKRQLEESGADLQHEAKRLKP